MIFSASHTAICCQLPADPKSFGQPYAHVMATLYTHVHKNAHSDLRVRGLRID